MRLLRLRSFAAMMVERRALQVAAAGVMGAILVTCTGESTAPRPMMRLSVAPHFVAGAAVPGNALTIDQVRALVIRPPQDTVVDQTFPFPAGASSVPINLTVPLQQSPDSFSLRLEYEHGTEVLYSGVQGVSLAAGVAPQPVTVPISYSGPGTSATSLTLAPRDTQLSSGDQLQFRVTVLADTVPDSVYVGWRTSNAGQAIDATGHLKATLVRGVITVYAQSPTPPGLQDSTTVHIVPKPVGLVKVSGDGQTGTATTPLPLPLVVQVNGSDLLGVPGVPVTFAMATGGGSVDTANVVTDSLGRASTGVILGPSTGNQTFTASAIGLSVTFAANGSAAPPKTWSGAVSTDWNVAGNWTPSGVPTATDSVTIPSTTNQPHIHTGAYSVHGMSVQSGALVTLDTAVLTDLGGYGAAGGLLDPNASSTIILAGAGSTLSGNLNVKLLSLQGSYSLGGDIQTSNLQVLGALTLAGHAAVAINTVTTAGTGVITMTNSADSLVSQGTAAFAGGVETGRLTAGTFVLSGNFAAATTSAFDAGPALLTVFNGSAQTVTVFDSIHSNQFGSVSFQNATTVVFTQLTGINGDATLGAGTVVTSTDTTYNGGGMALNGGVTTTSGSVLRVGRLYVNTAMSFAAGTYASTAIILTGTGQALPGGFTYPFVYVGGGNVALGAGPYNIVNQLAVQGGTLTLGANLTFPGNTFVQLGGALVLNGHTLTMGGNFTSNLNGLLQMTNPADTLVVGGTASFGGASEPGHLTAGGIIVGGDFTEGGGDPQAFGSTGTAVLMAGGGVQHMSFSHPGGAGASHFYDLGISNGQGALTLQSDVFIMHGEAFLGGAPKIVHGGGQVVHFANMTFSGVTFDNLAIAYDAALGGANLIALDSITFENYNVNSATPLIDIVSPGNTASPGTPFLFDNMVFFTDIAGGSGNYLRVTDSTSGDGNVLTIDINSGLVVSEGIAHTIMVGGAVVNWAQP